MNSTKKNYTRAAVCVLLCFMSLLPVSSAKNVSATDAMIVQTLAVARKAESSQKTVIAAEAYGKAVALTRRQPIKKQKDLPVLLYSYGQSLSYAGNYESAVTALEESLKMARESGDKKLEARSLTQIGIINFFLKNWDKALTCYRQAEKLAKEIGNKQVLSVLVNDIANIYQKRHNYRRAIEGYQQCLKIQNELHDSSTISNALFNISTCYDELGNESKAYPYLYRSYVIAAKIKDPEMYSLAAAHIAKRLIIQGKVDSANKLFRKAEIVTRENKYKQVRAEVYRIRSLALAETGDYKGALTYYKKMDMLSESLQKEQAQRQIDEFQIKYKIAEKERMMEYQSKVIRNKNILQYILMGGMVVCLVILFIVNHYRRVIRHRNRQLRETNNMKDKFFSIISHDLKNPVQSQKNALSVLVDDFDNMSFDEVHKICIELLDSSKALLDLLYNLLNWSRLQTGRMVYTPSVFPLIDVIRSVETLVHVQLKEKSLILDVSVPEDTIVMADRNMISTVIRNLLSNAIKFSYKGGTIKISAEKKDGSWLVSVADNGIGIEPNDQAALFGIEYQQPREGTNGEIGSGLGLVVCKEILKLHGTKISLTSETGNGAEFSFTLQEG